MYTPVFIVPSVAKRPILEFSKENQSIKIEYIAESRHCHSGNIVQGGYVTGWIDSAMAHSVMIPTDFEFSPLTLELKITFLKSANPGIVIAAAKVIKLGKSVAFVEGTLSSICFKHWLKFHRKYIFLNYLYF